ncbi:MAG TPA: hypothetical protein DCS93_32460 [Microscillaceae bacterium]|nr:hypothetical protein [Microscillaceae bacterium]
MKSDALGKVGQKIREIRKDQKLTLKDVAEKSGITTGLLSKIENFRTIPSLPVLHNISIALDVPMSELVKPVNDTGPEPYILIRSGEGESETREDSPGLTYESLVSQGIANINIRANIVKVAPNTYRPPTSTDAMELLHVLTGTIHYGLDEEILELQPGDTLYFDGAIPHSVENKFDAEASLFKVYLLRGN